ncbi:MAG: methionine ABC transporter ATP-binding protein [Chlamydiales bacterium]|nr:methionine ABC transporter ATP-binding protein [Chlamydiales bacterium]
MSIVKIKRLAKRFGEAAALEEISLSIEKGEVFGIIGQSGAGKSTLLRLLVGLDTPTSGEIEVNGEIGMIFQHFNLFGHLTALGNVLFPMPTPDEKKALELLRLVGLEEKAHEYPARLSGGEKQRVAIARALANDPQLLICDEATSALDPDSTQNILDLLTDLNEKLGLTIVLITHEMDVVKAICTKLAVLDGGKIVDEGSVADLLAEPNHPTTERFLGRNGLFQFSTEGELLRLFFRGGSAKNALITELVRASKADLNILRGGIDVLRNEVVGNLVVELTGEKSEREKVHALLKEKGIHFEVLPCT